VTTSIDSNVIVALWWDSRSANRVAANMLKEAHKRGNLIMSAPVYAELIADPRRSEAELDEFALDTGISIEWKIDEEIWREAGRAYRSYAMRRVRSGGNPPRRILADFIIGAHALKRGYSLLTLNGSDFSAAFPALTIVSC
jgi:predicted nucleic acid-binding protein